MTLGAREMAHHLRALAAFLKNLGSIPSTYLTPHNYLQLQTQGIWQPLPASVEEICIWHTDTHAGKMLIYTTINKIKIKNRVN